MYEMTEGQEAAISEALQRLVEEFQEDTLPQGKGDILPDLPEGTRQILLVEDYIMYSSNWVVSAANPAVSSQAYILLRGRPSPNSDVTSAYLRFVEPAQMRRPSYSAVRKQIQLYYAPHMMPQVLEQLKHGQRYAWVGHFAGGHYYGDLHSTP